jgi:ABC-type glycerol-3-phosphate transport system substrate-binding protein
MESRLDRRSLLKSGAAAASAIAISKRSSVFAAPATIKQTGSKVKVTYWGSFSDALGEAETAVAKMFNDSQQDVELDYQFQGTYEETAQKLTAALAAKQTPDISLLSDVWWFKIYIHNTLAPMNDFISSNEIDTTDFVDSLYIEGVRNDKVYWLPFARSTPLFYYNKEAFADAGIEGPPATWSDFAEVAPKLVKKDGDTVTQAAFAHPNAGSYIAWLFQGVDWAWGGSFSDPDFTIRINEQPSVDAGNFYRQSIADGWAVAVEDQDKDFVNGLCAATTASTGGLAGITKDAQFEFGTAFAGREAVRLQHWWRRTRPDESRLEGEAGSGIQVHCVRDVTRNHDLLVAKHWLHARAQVGGDQPIDAGFLRNESELQSCGRSAREDQTARLRPRLHPGRRSDHRQRARANHDQSARRSSGFRRCRQNTG